MCKYRQYGVFMEFSKISNLDVVTVPHCGGREFFINSQGYSDSDQADILKQISNFLKTNQASSISCRVAIPKDKHIQVAHALKNELPELICPIIWFTQSPGDKCPTFVVQLHALSGSPIEVIPNGNSPTGCIFEDDHVRYYQLHLFPDNKQTDNQTQTYSVFQKMDTVLHSCGLDFLSTARTWLYAHDILSWYDKLNRARDRFFTEKGVFNHRIPASTGVSLSNPLDYAIQTELLAAVPKKGSVQIRPVESPLQCPATQYRSSFSRAMEIVTPQQKRLYISGTASIDPHGKTIFLDNTPGQIDHTMNVVKAILQHVDMEWRDTVRAIAYFKSRKDYPLFDQWLQMHKIPLPHIKLECDICRNDLLFELELDAIQTYQ